MNLPNSRSSIADDTARPEPDIGNPALASIASGAPLAQTLDCIVRTTELQEAGIRCAIVLLDAQASWLQLGAAPSLPGDYLAALGRLRLEDAVDPASGACIESTPLWPGFRALAQQYGLDAVAAAAIRSGRGALLGLVAAYADTPDRAGEGLRHPLADAALMAAIAIERNIAELKVKVAESSKSIMALAIKGSATGIWDRNLVNGEIAYSDGWAALLGYAKGELSNRIEDAYERLHPDDREYVKKAIQSHADGRTESYEVEHRIRCKDGSYKWICSRGRIVSHDGNGRPLRMVGTTTDITAMRTLSERLQQSVDLITNLTDQVPGLVYQQKRLPDGRSFFSYASAGIRDIYELSAEQVASDMSAVHRIIHPDDLAAYLASLAASADRLEPWHLEYRVDLPLQGVRWRQGDARPHRLDDGSTVWHGFITDITERKRIELELHEFATVDFLTQLANRRHFMEQMEKELVRLKRIPGSRAAVLMCDLDFFKAINDTHGHAVGDRVLQHFGALLRKGLRNIDIAGRVGGEEFAIVLPGADVAAAGAFGRRLQQLLADQPFRSADGDIALTISIGVAALRAADSSAGVAMSRSDNALYIAKRNGRNRVELAPA